VKPLLEIDSIRALLTAARRMVDELDADGLLPRLLHVLEGILPEDRGVLLDVLEHDVVARTAIDDGNLWGRYKLYPNPFARLYHRTNAPEPAHSLAYEETVHSSRMGARMSMTVTRTPDWRPSDETLAVCARLTAEERACVISVGKLIRDRLRARVPA
jgi:hypothetical protein